MGNMVYPREPQVGKGEIRCVGGGGNNLPPPYLTEPGGTSRVPQLSECS